MKTIWSQQRSAYKAEQKKQRYRKVWLVPAGFLVILALWMSVSMRNFTTDDLTKGYQWLFYHLALLNAIFVPVMLAVIASRLCDMEIKGSTFKLLYTLEEPGRFYDMKFLAEVKYLLFFSVGEILVILLLGRLFCISEPVRLLPFAQHFLAVTAVGAVLFSPSSSLSGALPAVRQPDPAPVRRTGRLFPGALLHVLSPVCQSMHRVGIFFHLLRVRHQLGRDTGRR